MKKIFLLSMMFGSALFAEDLDNHNGIDGNAGSEENVTEKTSHLQVLPDVPVENPFKGVPISQVIRVEEINSDNSAQEPVAVPNNVFEAQNIYNKLVNCQYDMQENTEALVSAINDFYRVDHAKRYVGIEHDKQIIISDIVDMIYDGIDINYCDEDGFPISHLILATKDMWIISHFLNKYGSNPLRSWNLKYNTNIVNVILGYGEELYNQLQNFDVQTKYAYNLMGIYKDLCQQRCFQNEKIFPLDQASMREYRVREFYNKYQKLIHSDRQNVEIIEKQMLDLLDREMNFRYYLNENNSVEISYLVAGTGSEKLLKKLEERNRFTPFYYQFKHHNIDIFLTNFFDIAKARTPMEMLRFFNRLIELSSSSDRRVDEKVYNKFLEAARVSTLDYYHPGNNSIVTYNFVINAIYQCLQISKHRYGLVSVPEGNMNMFKKRLVDIAKCNVNTEKYKRLEKSFLSFMDRVLVEPFWIDEDGVPLIHHVVCSGNKKIVESFIKKHYPRTEGPECISFGHADKILRMNKVNKTNNSEVYEAKNIFCSLLLAASQKDGDWNWIFDEIVKCLEGATNGSGYSVVDYLLDSRCSKYNMNAYELACYYLNNYRNSLRQDFAQLCTKIVNRCNNRKCVQYDISKFQIEDVVLNFERLMTKHDTTIEL